MWVYFVKSMLHWESYSILAWTLTQYSRGVASLFSFFFIFPFLSDWQSHNGTANIICCGYLRFVFEFGDWLIDWLIITLTLKQHWLDECLKNDLKRRKLWFLVTWNVVNTDALFYLNWPCHRQVEWFLTPKKQNPPSDLNVWQKLEKQQPGQSWVWFMQSWEAVGLLGHETKPQYYLIIIIISGDDVVLLQEVKA